MKTIFKFLACSIIIMLSLPSYSNTCSICTINSIHAHNLLPSIIDHSDLKNFSFKTTDSQFYINIVVQDLGVSASSSDPNNPTHDYNVGAFLSNQVFAYPASPQYVVSPFDIIISGTITLDGETFPEQLIIEGGSSNCSVSLQNYHSVSDINVTSISISSGSAPYLGSITYL